MAEEEDRWGYSWSDRDSVLWPTRLLEMEATVRHRRMWHTVQRQCSLPDSEYLIYYF